MKEWLNNNWKKVLILGFIFVFGIPLLINILFKFDYGIEIFRAEWDSGDALSFYGVLLAAFFAVYGVYLSIEYSKKNYRDDLRNQVLPFFTVYNLKTKSSSNWLSTPENDKTSSTVKNHTEGYEEYKVTDYCYILNDGNIEIRNGLAEKQKELLNNGGFKWITKGAVKMCVASDHICHPMEIENVGNGTAISFRIGLNRKDTLQTDKLYAYAIPIKVGEKIMVRIFSEDCGKKSPNLGEYVLEFHYKDIYGNEYSQQHDISLEYSDEHHSPMISILFEEKQNLIKKADSTN